MTTVFSVPATFSVAGTTTVGFAIPPGTWLSCTYSIGNGTGSTGTAQTSALFEDIVDSTPIHLSGVTNGNWSASGSLPTVFMQQVTVSAAAQTNLVVNCSNGTWSVGSFSLTLTPGSSESASPLANPFYLPSFGAQNL